MLESIKKNFNNRYFFILLAIALCLLGLALVTIFWVGFRNYIDGVFAIRAALLWLDDFPYLGTTHWELRLPYVLSMSLSILMFGTNEFSVLAPNIAAFLAIIVITLGLFYKNDDTARGVIASLVLLSVPLFAFSATTLVPELIEFLFVLSSVMLFFVSTLKEKTSWVPYFLAGILGGLAFATRETAFALVVFYFVLFVGRFGGKRSVYFIVTAGFTLPVIADFAYVYFQSSDLFYKLKIDFQQYHDWEEMRNMNFMSPEIPVQKNAAEYTEATNKEAFLFATHKTLAMHLSSFFKNHEYQAIFFLMVPAAVYLLIIPPKREWLRRLLFVLNVLAICWFITVVIIIDLDSLPRYLIPVAYAAVVTTAAAIYELIKSKKHFIVYPVIFSLLGLAVLSYDLQQENLLTKERILVEMAETHNEVIYVPPKLLHSAKFFLQTGLLEKKVDSTPPPVGALYVYSKIYLKGMSDSNRLLYAPDKSWEVVETFEPRKRILGSILERVGVLERVPKYYRKKIYKPGSVLTLYRVR